MYIIIGTLESDAFLGEIQGYARFVGSDESLKLIWATKDEATQFRDAGIAMMNARQLAANNIRLFCLDVETELVARAFSERNPNLRP